MDHPLSGNYWPIAKDCLDVTRQSDPRFMRWLTVLTCLVLGACSSTVYDPPPVYAPELSKAIEGPKRPLMN
jgi:hypothetical protein